MKIKPYFLQKIKVKKIKVLSAAIFLGTLRVNYCHQDELYMYRLGPVVQRLLAKQSS